MPGHGCQLVTQPLYVSRSDVISSGTALIDPTVLPGTNPARARAQLDTWLSSAQFCCPVMSVDIHPSSPYAVITESDSEWVMARCAFEMGHMYQDESHAASAFRDSIVPWRDLQVGDVVWIGNTASLTHTDCYTVMEIRDEIERSYNGTLTDGFQVVGGSHAGESTGGAHDTEIANTGSTNYRTNTAGMLDQRAVRLSACRNVTTLPSLYLRDISSLTTWAAKEPSTVNNTNWSDNPRYMESPATPVVAPTATQLALDVADGTNVGAARPEPMENLVHPLYRITPGACTGTKSLLKLTLPCGTKRVHRIVLRGYEFTYLPAPGHAQLGDPAVLHPEVFQLRIRELRDGTAIMANQTAVTGAFAVLPVDSSEVHGYGSASRHEASENGIAYHTFATPVSLGTITLEVFDRNGYAAKLGHAHFWFDITYED